MASSLHRCRAGRKACAGLRLTAGCGPRSVAAPNTARHGIATRSRAGNQGTTMPRAQGRAWRAALWIAAALAGGLSAQGAAAQDATAPDRNLSFTVMRNGSVIGHHDVT